LRSNLDPEAIRTALVDQLYTPVRWTQLVQALAQDGIQQVIECGPGKVLWGLNRRAVEGLSHASLHDATAIQAWEDKLHATPSEISL
jgi:[acyl-carrier-protein] S-malonyltransferase